jgi:4-hydroxybenzoate polyprenyltransferase
MNQILDSLRLSMTIPAALLVHTGFAVSHQETNWLLVLLIFCIASMTMVQNDYFDREHDLKKGKDFAFKNQKILKYILLIIWILDKEYCY